MRARLPDVVAHRGGTPNFGENSLSAFRWASTIGVQQVELDVHASADRKIVVIHDATIDQTTCGKGPVEAHTAAELSAIRLRGMKEGVPTLEDVLSALAPGDMRIRIELKKSAAGAYYPGLDTQLMEIVEGQGLKDRVVIMCFDLEPLKIFSRAGYETSLSYSRVYRPEQPPLDALLPRLKDEGVRDIGVSFAELKADMIERTNTAGLSIGVWTVNGVSRLSYWLGMPVSYVLTDQAELARQLRTS